MVPTAAWVDLCGVRVTRFTDVEFLALVRRRLDDTDAAPVAVGSVNLDHIHHFGTRRRRPARNPGAAHHERWLLLADGAPISRRATAVSRGPWPRLAGADLLPLVLAVAQESGARVGFLGGTTQSADALRDSLRSQWPGLAFAGCWTPPREDLVDVERSRQVAAAIVEARVDLLVVGLGKPLQEVWIDRYGDQTGARVLTAFGGAANFLSGTTRRAPRWMRAAGCEWMFRLAVEPRRLARRYVLQGPSALCRLRTYRPKKDPR